MVAKLGSWKNETDRAALREHQASASCARMIRKVAHPGQGAIAQWPRKPYAILMYAWEHGPPYSNLICSGFSPRKTSVPRRTPGFALNPSTVVPGTW